MLLGQLIWDPLQFFHALLLPEYHLDEGLNLIIYDRYPLFKKKRKCNIVKDKWQSYQSLVLCSMQNTLVKKATSVAHLVSLNNRKSTSEKTYTANCTFFNLCMFKI
jgi:hypothetical protein